MMKMLIVLLCVFTTSVYAIDSVDVVGFVFDPGTNQAQWSTHQQTVMPFQEVTVYLVIANPSLGGASGWAADVDLQGPAVAWHWDTGLMSIPEPIAPFFQVSYGLGDQARYPNSAGMLWLLRGTGFIMDPTDEVTITVMGIPASTRVVDAPAYIDPNDPTIAQALTVPVGDYSLPCFIFNGTPPIANDTATWGRIKSIFAE